jgi:hypothetical protein
MKKKTRYEIDSMEEYNMIFDNDYEGENSRYLYRKEINTLLKNNIISIDPKTKLISWNIDKLCMYEEFISLCEEKKLYWEKEGEGFLKIDDPNNEYLHVEWGWDN